MGHAEHVGQRPAAIDQQQDRAVALAQPAAWRRSSWCPNGVLTGAVGWTSVRVHLRFRPHYPALPSARRRHGLRIGLTHGSAEFDAALLRKRASHPPVTSATIRGPMARRPARLCAMHRNPEATKSICPASPHTEVLGRVVGLFGVVPPRPPGDGRLVAFAERDPGQIVMLEARRCGSCNWTATAGAKASD
jgi:hypothetical protein